MPQNDDFVIEPATGDDVSTITDHWIRLAREQRVHGSHVLPEANRDAIFDVLGAHRVSDGLLVARLGGEIVGFASFSQERGMLAVDVSRGLLSNLYVKPGYRGRGIGSALLAAVEAALSERGVEILTLETMAANDAARRFYERNDYEAYRVALERDLRDVENDTHSREHG